MVGLAVIQLAREKGVHSVNIIRDRSVLDRLLVVLIV
jgi:hypothetical protein